MLEFCNYYKGRWKIHFFSVGLLLLTGFKLHAIPFSNEKGKDTSTGNDLPISLKFSGYVQPQFQISQQAGIKSFSGGNFPEHVNNRFMLRRARLKATFQTNDTNSLLQTSFVFQIDATERGVVPRDIYGEISEQYFGLLSVRAGLFVRPFGFEVPYSSQQRESPERGRMSQLLMKTERDVGAMLSLHPKSFKGWQLDVAVFNGPGLSAPADYDSYKDMAGRLHYQSGKGLFGAGISGYYGSVLSDSVLVYEAGRERNMIADVRPENKDRRLQRRYFGADAQWKIKNKKGFTELRAELISGHQTGTRLSSETPGDLKQPLALRSFTGGYFYLLQHLSSTRHQLVLKYDFYDPNTTAKGQGINADKGFNSADIAYQTFGGGYIWYASRQLKLTLWYDLVRNEPTRLAGYEQDLRDDVLTLRLQYQF